MTGWLVNDNLTCIGGTRTLWHYLLEGMLRLENRCTGSFSGLAEAVEAESAVSPPDYIIRNAAYFRPMAVNCPQIAFVQDILEGPLRDMLLDVCREARLTIFNSEFTRFMYPELATARNRVVPIGTDFDLFSPRAYDDAIPSDGVLYVGSSAPVKGWDLVQRLAAESTRPFVFVMKDEAYTPNEALTFRRIPQKLLARIASSCAVGICTSRVETQHLAGIEMGACGLPLVTTNVGAYWNRPSGDWGEVATDWHAAIERAAGLSRSYAREYWLAERLGVPECVAGFQLAVEGLFHAVR